MPSTFTVRSLADAGPGSLRAAIAAANANPGADLIRFAPAARDGTIALTTGQLNVTDDLTIDGPGARRLTVSGNNASRILNISGGATDVEIRQLTIANGRATGTTVDSPFGPVTLGGGILNTGGRLTLSHVAMSHNQAVGDITSGGAIANVFGATLTVGHSTFTDNRASGTFSGGGGGILNHAGSTLTVSHSTFTGNQATASQGGAAVPLGLGEAGAISNGGGSTATISHSRFEGNLARGGDGADGGPGQNGGPGGQGAGGALDNTNVSLIAPFVPSTMTITHSHFAGNLSFGGNGGDGGTGGNGGNGGAGNGGGLRNNASDADVSHCLFVLNQGVGGTGGNRGAGGLLGGNGGVSRGGGIFNIDGASVTLSHSMLVGNEVTGGAGGLGGNGGNGQGGGVFNGPPTALGAPSLTLLHSLVTLNQADGGAAGVGGSAGLGQGGGLYLTAGGEACADLATLLFANDASTSDDDVFGTLDTCP